MKNKVKLFFVILFVTITRLSGQASFGKSDSILNYKSCLKFDFFYGEIQFERRLSNNTGINLNVRHNHFLIINRQKANLIISADYRKYFSRCTWPCGWFLALYTDYENYEYKVTEKILNTKYSSICQKKCAGVGLKFGVLAKLLKRLTIDVGFGLGYNYYNDLQTIKGNYKIDKNIALDFNGWSSFGYLF